MRPITFKHRRRYGGATPAMGLHRGMRSVETHAQFLFGWTHEDLWLRVYRKSVVAVPVEVAPHAQRCRVKGQSTFDRIRQPQTKYPTQFYLFNTKLLEGSCANFIIPQLFSKQILLPDYLHVTSMNSIYYQQSELSVILEAHNHNSKVPNRERSEEKLMPSVLKDRFLSLNSHIFFFVVDQC